MIPEFPKYKFLELSDREEFIEFNKNFLPFSDFNFTSLFAWNILHKTQISFSRNNLIIKLSDYISGEPVYSFLGNEHVEPVATALFEKMKSEGLPQVIKLLPESVATGISGHFKIIEDRDNFDYVYSIEKLKTFKGNRLGAKRNFVNRFLKNYKVEVKIYSSIDSQIVEQVLQLFLKWQKDKRLNDRDVENEYKALERILENFDELNVFGVFVFSERKLIGFTINEVLNNKFGILHFEKADFSPFVGIYPFLMLETAKHFADKQCEFLNYEQDLGIEGLRKCKTSFFPEIFLKKYTLEPFAN